jgi:hypothetical protein
MAAAEAASPVPSTAHNWPGRDSRFAPLKANPPSGLSPTSLQLWLDIANQCADSPGDGP